MKNVLLLIVLVTGCTPDYLARPIQVKVPVAVMCEGQFIAEPEWNIPHLAYSASATVKLKAALSDLALSKGYSEELKAELEACSQD